MNHVILFDIDGTLLDAAGAGQQAMEETVAELFDGTKPVRGIPIAGRTDRAIAYDLFDYYNVPVTDANWERYRADYLTRLPRYLTSKPGFVYPGIPDILKMLDARGNVLLGLLTGNFEKGAWMKLEHFGIRQHFHGGGFGDDYLDRDDVARAARRWADSHVPNLAEEKVVVIGDTPADIRCGRAIGAEVIAVATAHYTAEQLQAHQPDHLVSDWSQGAAIFNTILSR